MAESDLSPFEHALSGLITSLEPAARRQLARQIAASIRTSQQARIQSQQNPDGSAYAPRKPQLRSKKGAIRRAMFSKLRTARFLKMRSSPDEAVITFANQVGRMAVVHQYGLRDRVRKAGPEAQYPARQLLGLTAAEVESVTDLVLEHLSR